MTARKNGLQPETFLQKHDSNAFFKRVGGLIITGRTGTNVNDVIFAIAEGGVAAATGAVADQLPRVPGSTNRKERTSESTC